jgi:hypothetical protein
LSLKIWSARAPIWRDRRAAASSPRAIPKWMPTRGASSGQLSRRRGSRRATVRVMEPPTADEREAGAPETPGPEGPDLVSIGLAVYFVAVILVVGALLLVSAAF